MLFEWVVFWRSLPFISLVPLSSFSRYILTGSLVLSIQLRSNNLTYYHEPDFGCHCNKSKTVENLTLHFLKALSEMLKEGHQKDPGPKCSSNPSCSRKHLSCLSTAYFVPCGCTFWNNHSRSSSLDTFSCYYCFFAYLSELPCSHHLSQMKRFGSISGRLLQSRSKSHRSSNQYAIVFSMKSTWMLPLRIPHYYIVATMSSFWVPVWLSQSYCPIQWRTFEIEPRYLHGAIAFAGQDQSSYCACWESHGIMHWTLSLAKIWSLLIESTHGELL